MNINASILWKDDRHFRLRETDFVLSEKVVDGFVCMKKNRPFIAEYEKIKHSTRVQNIVEIGVLWGGSTIFLNELFQPERLLAIDLKDQTQPFFKNYIEAKGKNISTQLSVSQDDKVSVKAEVVGCFGVTPLDLIVDDASHLYAQSVATFEVLFPLLRPEGVYVIEDWGWAHWPGMWQESSAPWQHQLSLVNMLTELSMACASKSDVIRRIEVTPTIIIVHRGGGVVEDFRLTSAFKCRGRPYNAYL